MDTETNNNDLLQVYNVNEDENLLLQVDKVICIFFQRGFLAAGFSAGNELLTIRYNGYDINYPVYSINFYEQVIEIEPLLNDKEKVKGVFFLGEKNMIVPNDLFQETYSKNWLKQIHFIEQNEVIDFYPLDQDKAYYLQAMPLEIKELVNSNFINAKILPLAYYQFRKPPKVGLALQCCVTNDQVAATMHIDGQLMWHSVYYYTVAEDIVFEGKLLCKENGFSATKLTILFNSFTALQFNLINDLTQYYPGLKSGEGNRILTSWDTSISLLQQLLVCV